MTLSITKDGQKRELLVPRSGLENKDELILCTYYSQAVGGPVITSSSFTKPKKLNNWEFTGADIPNFHAKKRRGDLLVETPYTSTVQYGQVEGVKDQLTISSGEKHWCFDHIYYEDWIPSWVDVNSNYIQPYISDKYVQEAAAAIYSSGHDTLTFLAELTDVRHMFLQTGKRLLRLSKLAPKGWKGMSSDWLSGRYGWRTLMFDLQDLNKAVKNLGDTRTRRNEKRGTKISLGTINSRSWDTSHAMGTRHHSWVDTVEIGLRGSVTADIEIPSFQFNPLVTGWEKIPFSFVVDWFVSIGKAIAAISFLSQATAYTASYGIIVKLEREYDMYISWASNYSGTDYQTGYSYTEVKQRIPCAIPYLPHFRVNLNPLKILDLLGLIIQRR